MLAIPKKSAFEFRGLTGVIDDVKERYVVMDFDEGGLKMFEPHQLQDAYVEGEFKILQAKSVNVVKNIIDKETSNKYNFIQTTVNFMHDSGIPMSERIATQAIAHAVSKHGLLEGTKPSASAAKRWYKKWADNGRSVSYILKKSKERRRSQFTRECEALADEIIAEHYLKLHGCSVANTYKLFLDAFKEYQPEWERANRKDNAQTGDTISKIKPMSRSSFYAYVDKYDAYEVDKARFGVKAARKKHRTVNSKIVTNRPLERVEIDAVYPNICLEVKNVDGTITFVRPIIYVAIDVHTRLVVGYVVDYSEGKPGETANAVAQLIKQICNPFKFGKHTGIPFPLGGKPECIVSDSGSAFNAMTVQMMLQTNAILHDVTPKASPWKKPFVERFFSTLKMQCMHTLPGYVAPRIRGVELDNTLEELAQLSKDEFETKLETYILSIYHHNPHRGLDDWSPIDAWEAIKDNCPPPILCDFSNLNKFHGARAERVISPVTGFSLNGVKYNCQELQKLGHTLARRNKNRPGARKIELMFNTSDISEVTVINPLDNDEIICVPSISQGVIQGTTLEEFKATKRAAKGGDKKTQVMPATEGLKTAKNKTNRSTTQAIPIDAAQSGIEDTFNNAIGKHADNHNHKKVTKGTPPMAAPRSTNTKFRASARR
ncbi:MAG: transposase family protein [Flavobacteriaceae bacterium]|nr:transposase family protein [Flavobacteriaceae bacterium]